MADRFQLDLKTIEISGQIFDLSLSMTSVAFIYNVPLRNITQSGLSSLILSKQLWLLPCGVSRLDVHVPLGECDIWREQQGDFFEFVGHTICQSSVSRLPISRVAALDTGHLSLSAMVAAGSQNRNSRRSISSRRGQYAKSLFQHRTARYVVSTFITSAYQHCSLQRPRMHLTI